MSHIIQRIVHTTRKRIEPVNGHTTADVVRLLNGGYADFLALSAHEHVVTLKDERGWPDKAKIIAHIRDTEGSTTGCDWKPGCDDRPATLVGDVLRQAGERSGQGGWLVPPELAPALDGLLGQQPAQDAPGATP